MPKKNRCIQDPCTDPAELDILRNLLREDNLIAAHKPESLDDLIAEYNRQQTVSGKRSVQILSGMAYKLRRITSNFNLKSGKLIPRVDRYNNLTGFCEE